MLTNPQSNHVDNRRVIGKTQLAFIILSALFALVCDFMLLSFRSGEQSALSGQLLEGGEASSGSFLSYVFDYFGNVTYLVPYLAVYVVTLFCLSSFSLKNVDFFKVGLRLLGINTLIIGLCMLFSGLMVSDSMGGGGILGDYLNIACFSNMPRYAAPFIPVALTFLGLMLSTAHSPLWFCDTLGALIMRFVPFGKDDEATSDNQLELPDHQKTSGMSFNVRHNVQTDVLTKESRDDQEIAKQDARQQEARQEVAPRFFRGVSDLKTKLRFGSEVSEPAHSVSKTEPAFQSRVEPSFGMGASSQAASLRGSAQEYYDPSSVQAQRGEQRADISMSRNVLDDTPRTICPAFRENYTDERQIDYGHSGQYEDENNRIYSGVAGKAYANADDDTPNGVSTIISGYAHDSVSSPVAEASAAHDEEEPVQRTIITRNEDYLHDPEERREPSFGSYTPEIKEEHTDKPVADDEDDGGISTVVTRGQSITKMKAGEDVETIHDPTAGAENDYSSIYGGMSSASIPATSGDLPPQEDETYGNFSFSDEQSSEENAPSDEEPYEYANRTVSEPISERDLSYSDSYTKAVRGLGEHSEPAVLEKRESGNDHGSYAENVQSVETIDGSKASYYGFVRHDDGKEQKVQSADDVGSVKSGMQAQSQVYQQTVNDQERGTRESYAEASAAENSTDQYSVEEKTEVPTASVHKFPTKDYVSSVATVPSACDPDDLWRPPFELLASSEHSEMVDEATIHNFIERINRTFQDFSVQAKVASYQAGPVITRYDVKLDRGVKSSVIRGLQADLSRTLTTTVRVLDVVPGTPYMGLEIPNPKRKLITLRDVVESEQFLNTRAQLPLCLGVDAAGVPVVADLAKAPHLLIAGTTGSGKSAGINSMLLSLLLTRSPAELRFILVDPKQVEFSLYEDLPHLICPVISETDETMAALQWCVGEMERRYRLISNLKLRSVSEYNAYIRQQNSLGKVVFDPAWSPEMGGQPTILRPLPAIVMVIDEFADLMAAFEGRGKNKGPQPDQLVQRLAQKARAASMHLMLATQSPRSSVITGTLKANLPSRIAYTVQSNLDSRVILDDNGAENLLGNGDMLAKLMGLANNQLFRAHGPFASNKDVNAVVEAWKGHCGAPEYLDGVTDLEDPDDDSEPELGSASERSHKLDKDYDAVVAYVREYQNQNNGAAPSMSLVQTEFCFGYPRTKKIFMQMKRNGDL